MPFNFKAARERIEQLRSMYRRLVNSQPKDGCWDWWLENEIAELEADITEAHKAKLAGVGADESSEALQTKFALIVAQ
jgi:hypothetical protein